MSKGNKKLTKTFLKFVNYKPPNLEFLDLESNYESGFSKA